MSAWDWVLTVGVAVLIIAIVVSQARFEWLEHQRKAWEKRWLMRQEDIRPQRKPED